MKVSSFMHIGVCVLVVGCMAIPIGCDTRNDEFRSVNLEYATAVSNVIGEICCGNRPSNCARELMLSVVSITNVNMRMQRMRIITDAMSKATFFGNNVHDRENSQARFHAFREKASQILYGEKCWRAILELWFAETKSLKRESEFCEKKCLEAKGRGLITWPGEVAIQDREEDWYTSARHSESLCKDNIAYIVLWDDSVAARYCATLSWWEKMKVVWRIKKVIGRYPDWYLEEKNGAARPRGR